MTKNQYLLLSVLGVSLLVGSVVVCFPSPRPSHACQSVECAKNACLILDRNSDSCHGSKARVACTDVDCILLAHPCQRP